MSTSTSTRVVGMDLIDVPTRNRYEPDVMVMHAPDDVRVMRDGRGITYRWTASEPTEGESVAAVELSVFWHADGKCYVATAMPVEVEIDHGMTIVKIANLIGGPTTSVRSERFPRFNRKTLELFADSARVWLQRVAEL